MATLIAQVKSRLFIHSSRKSAHLLDGAYASLAIGRGLDFEDHREYQVGDDVRDIDWRATARVGSLLIKRSRATRMHTVLFAVDTGRSMRALAQDERAGLTVVRFRNQHLQYALTWFGLAVLTLWATWRLLTDERRMRHHGADAEPSPSLDRHA